MPTIVCNGKTVELVRPGLIPEPTICPVCGGAVQRKETQRTIRGAVTICVNPDCPAKQDGRLKTFIKKVNILGIGNHVRRAIQEQLGIFTPADLYRLGTEISEDELAGIMINETSVLGSNASKIISEINAKRTLPLHVFLGSLGIEALGRREVEIAIQKAPKDLSTLADWRSGKLRDPDIQTKLNAYSKADKWANGIENNSGLIDKLLQYVTVVEPSPDNISDESSTELSGSTVCITGTLPSGKKKKDYKDLLADAGFVLVDKVSKNLDFLVLADPNSTSNKAKKARQYNFVGANIKLIDEDELIGMVQ